MVMTHKQRIENALAFKATDRLPYSLWMHFPNRDRHPRRLAELSLQLQKQYDYDFIKFMPFGMFSTIDYGVDLNVFPGFSQAPVAYKPIIEHVNDWDKISYRSGTSGEFALILESQRLLFEMMDERIPFVQTIFSPMTTAAKLCSPELLLQHLQEKPHKVVRALELFTVAAIEFAKASVNLGADGFFYATQMSSHDLVNEEQYEQYIKKYDLELIKATQDKTWFNILHLHGRNAYLQHAQDYPVQAISWHDRDEGPKMKNVRAFNDKVFVGGLSTGEAWHHKSVEQITQEVKDTAAFQNGIGTILAPGCVISPDVTQQQLDAVYAGVLATEKEPLPRSSAAVVADAGYLSVADYAY